MILDLVAELFESCRLGMLSYKNKLHQAEGHSLGHSFTCSRGLLTINIFQWIYSATFPIFEKSLLSGRYLVYPRSETMQRVKYRSQESNPIHFWWITSDPTGISSTWKHTVQYSTLHTAPVQFRLVWLLCLHDKSCYNHTILFLHDKVFTFFSAYTITIWTKKKYNDMNNKGILFQLKYFFFFRTTRV